MSTKTTLLRTALAALVLTASAAAAETWTGRISDSNCGASHDTATEHGKKMTDAACTAACVKGGAQYVLVKDGKVYKIANQDAPGLARHAGHDVTVTGSLSGDTITVTKVDAAKGAKKG
jgi:hypothetical protein